MSMEVPKSRENQELARVWSNFLKDIKCGYGSGNILASHQSMEEKGKIMHLGV